MTRPATNYNPNAQRARRVHALSKVFTEHKRAVSHDPHFPLRCICGWKGTGENTSTLEHHYARQVLHFIEGEDATGHDEAPSIETIALHRARDEALCKACTTYLRRLQ
jgi:hypothetical protein